MKLIEALIIAQQEYGIYGDWKATHTSQALQTEKFIGRGPYASMMYVAYDRQGLISQSERLETVLSDFAERYPYAMLDERWKVSRWLGIDVYSCRDCGKPLCSGCGIRP